MSGPPFHFQIPATLKNHLEVPGVSRLNYYSEKQVRRKPKKKLTPLQENRLLKIILVLVTAAFIWVLFAPNTGIYSLLKMRNKTASLQIETEQLVESNKRLREEIDRIKNDPVFLEQIAREKYGLIKKNEQVFDFSKPTKDSAKDK